MSKKLKILSIALLAVALTIGVAVLITWVVNPKPVSMINPTEFSTLESVGVLSFHRLRPVLLDAKVLVIGSVLPPDSSGQIWTGLLKMLALEGWEPNLLIEEGSSKFLGPQLKVTSVELLADEKPTQVKQLGDSIQKILLHGPAAISSQFFKDSWSHWIEVNLDLPVVSLTLIPWKVVKDGTQLSDTDCKNEDAVGSPSQRLTCTANAVSRKFIRKKLDATKSYIVMERHGLRDYLIFIYNPQLQ